MKMRIIITILFFTIFNINTFCQSVFDIGIRNIEIFFNDPNWDDSLDLYYANNLGQRMIADSVLIDGVADQDVGIKYKGNLSYNPNNSKNPINIKLDYINNGQSINGYNVLKLSNGFRDPSFVREVLSYEIARNYMPAPKASYAKVSINGNLIGIYTCIQSVDNDFTNENYYERKGPFFKAEITGVNIAGCSGQPGIMQHFSDTNCYKQFYVMQSSNDWKKLGNFLDTLNNHFTSIENVMDIDRALWMMAFENLTVSLDGPINSIQNNFYLFKDNNGRFNLSLWDMNQSLGVFTEGLPNPVQLLDLQELDIFHKDNDSDNKLTTQIFSSERYKRMYVAHMRTILNEQFANNNYLSRASQLQQLIDSELSSDPNTFFSYSDFTSNLNSSVGSGSVTIVGISELMNSRISYLQNLNEFTSISPTITITNNASVLPHSTVNITANIQNSNYAYLGYRFKFADKFMKIQMFDDGSHGDGIAGDGIFGATINVDARDIQYYIYAENNDAGIFSPERAEKEFHQIAVVSGLVINEIMAANFSEVADQSGEYDDWVELYNGGNSPINLNGFYLSDNENDLTKWSFPNVTIQPNDYLIVWCDTAGSSQSGLHTTYRLSSDQEEVYLTDPSGVVVDAVHFVNMPSDIAYARVPNGHGVFTHQLHSHEENNNTISSNNNLQIESKMRLYPNPSNNRVYVLGASKRIEVFNILGKRIYHSEEEVDSINVSEWNSGIYFVKSGRSVVKFIKQ